MNTDQTREHLVSSLESIEAAYEDFGAILNRVADRETIEIFAEHHGLSLPNLGVYEEDLRDLADDDSGTLRDEVCGNLEGAAMDAMNDYPLSIDDSHVWFTLGGPNISANITGWRVNTDNGRPWVDVQDITLKGRWGGASVDRDVWRGSFLFDQVAEMFEHNLLMKFNQL